MKEREDELKTCQDLVQIETKKRVELEKKLADLDESLQLTTKKLDRSAGKLKQHETDALAREKTEASLKAITEELREEIRQLEIPDQLLEVICEWVHKHNAFVSAAKHQYKRAFLSGCNFTWGQILMIYPDSDLNKFRAFPTEMIKKTEETLFKGVQFRPPVYFDHTLLADREETVPEIPYPTAEPMEDELLLPDQFYDSLRAEMVKYFEQRKTVRRFLDVDQVLASIPPKYF